MRFLSPVPSFPKRATSHVWLGIALLSPEQPHFARGKHLRTASVRRGERCAIVTCRVESSLAVALEARDSMYLWFLAVLRRVHLHLPRTR